MEHFQHFILPLGFGGAFCDHAIQGVTGRADRFDQLFPRPLRQYGRRLPRGHYRNKNQPGRFQAHSFVIRFPPVTVGRSARPLCIYVVFR